MVILLLLGSLLPQSDFSQLRRLPQLFAHYDVHIEQAADQGTTLSFGEFLFIHFIHPDQHQHGDNSHQELPLQHIGTGYIAALPSVSAIPMPSHEVSLLQAPSFAVKIGFSRDFTGMILRPPIA